MSVTRRSDGVGGIDVGAARDVLLEHVVLHRAAKLAARHALLLAGHDVHRQQDRGGRVDRHRGRHPIERNLAEQRLEILHGVDRHADAADLARRHRMIGVVAHLGRQVERGGESGLPAASSARKRALVSAAVPKPAYCRIVHGRRVYISGYAPRVNGNCPGCTDVVSGITSPVRGAASGGIATRSGSVIRRPLWSDRARRLLGAGQWLVPNVATARAPFTVNVRPSVVTATVPSLVRPPHRGAGARQAVPASPAPDGRSGSARR